MIENLKNTDKTLLTIESITDVSNINLINKIIEFHIYDKGNNYINSIYNLQPTSNNNIQWELQDIPSTETTTSEIAEDMV